MRVSALFLLILLTLSACSQIPHQAEDENPGVENGQTAGLIEEVPIRGTERHVLSSVETGEDYEIDVWLPKDYQESENRYPVLYICDAEYNFGAVSYIARRLIKNNEIEPLILVGIAYDTSYEDFYDKRSRDLTPTESTDSSSRGWQSGGAVTFASFLGNELIPWVNKRFRALPEDRGICGHSFGGLFASYLLFSQPDLFQRYLIISPSYWYDDEVSFSFESEHAAVNDDLAARVYLSVGARERSHMVSNVRKMERILRGRAYPGLTLGVSVIEEETHRSVFPFSFTKGLRFLYPPSGR